MFINRKIITRVAAAAAVVMIGSDQKSFFANALQMTTSDHWSPTYVLGERRPVPPTNEEDGDEQKHEPVSPKNGRLRFLSGLWGKTGSSGSPKHNPDASTAIDPSSSPGNDGASPSARRSIFDATHPDADYETAISDVSMNGYIRK